MKPKDKDKAKDEINKIELKTRVRRFTSGAYIPVSKKLADKFVKVIIEVLE